MPLFFRAKNFDKQKSSHTYVRLLDVSYGGDKEDRTPDLLHAMQALSQLSYAPVSS